MALADGAATERHEAPRRFTAHQKFAERVHPPEVFERRGVHLPKIDLQILVSVIGDQVGGTLVVRHSGALNAWLHSGRRPVGPH